MEADLDRDGRISFEEFTKMVENTDVSMSMTLGETVLPLALSAVTFRLSSCQDYADSPSRSVLMIPPNSDC